MSKKKKKKNKAKVETVKKEALEWTEDNILKSIVDITRDMNLDNKEVVALVSKITGYTGSKNQLQFLHKLGKEKTFTKIDKLLEKH